MPELDRLGLLTVVDGDALAAYCTAWSEFREATETIAREGRFVTNGAGTMKSHPAVDQLHVSWTAIRQFSAMYGLDPASRSRICVPEPDKSEKDALSAFLGETG